MVKNYKFIKFIKYIINFIKSKNYKKFYKKFDRVINLNFFFKFINLK